jgi:GGDEF domain-containing protein
VSSSDSLAPILDRARDALRRATIADDSPFATADANTKAMFGFDAGDHAARLEFWSTRHPGTRVGDDRYRWEISHFRCRRAPHVPPVETWRAFRPDVESNAARSEMRMSLPISIAEGCEYLAGLADVESPAQMVARTLLAEAEPLFRRDLAMHVQGSHPWSDTFALYCLVRRPRALERLRPLAVAIASVYAAAADEHGVRGLRYPFAEQMLPSATAQLAWGLVQLGLEVGKVSDLVDAVRRARRSARAWADGDAPDDLLVSLPCFELLSRLDPTFDAEAAAEWIGRQQREDGFFAVLGPEAPWLTGAFVELLEEAQRPFSDRFRWPRVPTANLDRKTGLPFYAYFDDLARLLAGLDGLAQAPTELAFLDLARFREFNNRYGQDMGDAVLEAFAHELRRVAGTAVIRDGGDEMLVVGAPMRTGLADDLDSFRRGWPARFRERFGADAPPVAPRILVTRTKGADLRTARETLGRGVGALKNQSKDVGDEGVLAQI